MEKFALILQSQPAIDAYIADGHLMLYEKAIIAEIVAAIANVDGERLNYFAGFGDSFRAITTNLNEYRRALEFGFTKVAFNQYGWFALPKFLDREDIKVEQSEIRIGHGPNGIWAYALNCAFGTGGGGGPLCVFCKKYPSRDAALAAAIEDMKMKMIKYLGNPNTLNYKQDLLRKTLKAIAAMEVGRVQLTLF